MGKFKIIYADPPWSFNNKNTGGSMVSGADSHYKTMSFKDICNLPINELTDENCVLFMWWVASQPLEAIAVVKAWGFTLKTMTGFVWVKRTKLWKLFFGMGFYTRAGSECCLIAIKGKPNRINGSVRSVVEAIVGKHSEKPAIFRDEIVRLMGNIPRLEMFARVSTPGWDVFGDEVENSVSLIVSKNKDGCFLWEGSEQLCLNGWQYKKCRN